MKRCIVITLACIAAFAGCAGQQDYDKAQRLYQLRQYDEAVAEIDKALASDPGNKKYIDLRASVTQEAARVEYQRGQQFYEKRQLDQALLAFEKAKNYSPDFKEAQQAYESVKKRKLIVQTVLTDVPQLLASNKPDEALAKLAEIEAFAASFPEIADLKAQALAASTIMHTKQGNACLAQGKFEEARKEFFVALNRTPNYRPAAEGRAKAEAELSAAKLVEEGQALLGSNQYEAAYAKFREAMKIVPGHKAALQAMIDTGGRWARALYDQGKTLEEKGDFDSLSEALRDYERAGALTERFADLDERVSTLKAKLAAEFLRRAEQYTQLGDEYLGLALIDYKMTLYCDPSQVEVARKAAEVKDAFERRRAFYIDIQAVDHSSAGNSFGKQIAQILKETALASGMSDVYVTAPFETSSGASAVPVAGGMPGRRLTIFAQLLSENVETPGKDKPEIVRSHYKLGTRFAPNPQYQTAREALAEAEAQLTEVSQRNDEALVAVRVAQTPEEKAVAESDADVQRRRLNDAEDNVTNARKALAATAEQVEQEIFQPYDYKVYTVTMNAKVEVSLEVGDPDTGATRRLQLIDGTATAQDTYNEGVSATDSEGVTPKAQNLPTESELLAAARKDTADKAVVWLKQTLGELSVRYYQKAKDLQEVGNVEGASEYFYAFYLSTPDKNSQEALEAVNYVRINTHLITPEETKPVRPVDSVPTGQVLLDSTASGRP
jgi:tetratricopeptide (TPR) repeat protein